KATATAAASAPAAGNAAKSAAAPVAPVTEAKLASPAVPAPEKKPAETTQKTPPAQAVAEDSDDDDAAAKPAAKVETKPEKKPEDKMEKKTPPPSGVRVQLGSYKSQAEADRNWTRISGKFGEDLASKHHYVIHADLGSKGVYYRLQVGAFSSSEDA